ncbi:HAD family phosphatase [Ramlibacter henchirensis]|uniref:HAD family phosphatase n=1 Tax=Ramlibacter henchirensis TaxID=204072 RepID=A0A4Z0C9Q0_9BURK|nr:HAD family phosphatase [Ramlibacter henchirensis]TFZ07130.1 HAD family phosphatase [Ramlibacter henchirensis]
MTFPSRYDAVLFDCDGVLVDSEPITNGVLREMLQELGWTLTAAECMRLFIGKAVKDERALIEARTGRPLTEEWLALFRHRRNERLEQQLRPIEGAAEAVAAVHAACEGRIACASGADRLKVELQLAKCGLMRWFEGRIFTGHELPRSKPAPDVYLAAAAAVGTDPRRCAVVEDTVTGVTAGVAAGTTVFGYSPPEAGHDAPAALLAAGAVRIFTSMRDLPALLA